MTFHEAYNDLKNHLYFLYDHAESANIADMIMEKITGLSKSERFINGLFILEEEKQKQYDDYKQQLLTGKPVQQILHEAWFHHLPFYVNEHVLIPRPETDELVEWIAEEIKKKNNSPAQLKHLKLLDIGTGSGCIAVSLKNEFTHLSVHALDISEEALKVAKYNANAFGAMIEFSNNDILNKGIWKELPVFDYIVSNPPYIKKSEAKAMRDNVISFEPHTALFVEDEEPLLFYRTIIEFAQEHLQQFGSLFFEINETLADDVIALLDENKFDEIELRADMQGKDRMIKASFL